MIRQRVLRARSMAWAALLAAIAIAGACGDDGQTAGASCSDGVQNGSETGVDCGPGCAQCLGAACEADAQCQTGHCVDGVCCQGTCSGECEACSAQAKGSGEDGVCGKTADGIDPRNDCEDEGPVSCGTNGVCDGAGHCSRYAAGTICGGAETFCAGGTQIDPDTCDAAGACAPGATTPCAPYTCGGTTCKTSCATEADCVAGSYCGGAACVPQKQDGASCAAAIECGSGHCVDGVCCNIACDLSCVACSAAKKGSGADGSCGVIADGTDPDDDCADDGPASCGHDGTCNGTGACRLYADGTTCSPSSCASGVQDNADLCSAGACMDTGTTACGAYVCGASACTTTCAQATDCVSGAFCNPNSVCLALKGQGASCQDDSECLSGNCTGLPGLQLCACGSSIDCNPVQYCSGFLCGAKKVNGSSCANDSECLSNRCIGTPLICDVCADSMGCLPSHYCSSSACVARQQTGAACATPEECLTSSCTGSPGVCDPCSANLPCASSHFCDANGSCQIKRARGGPCTTNGECGTGYCNPNLGKCN